MGNVTLIRIIAGVLCVVLLLVFPTSPNTRSLGSGSFVPGLLGGIGHAFCISRRNGGSALRRTCFWL